MDAGRQFRWFKRLPSRAGSVLIVSLWMLVILSLLAVAVSFHSHVRVKTNRVFEQWQVMDRKVLSWIDILRYHIDQDETPTVDSPEDEWYNPAALAGAKLPEGAEEFEIFIRDEESKVNFNLVPESMLKAYFERFGSRL